MKGLELPINILVIVALAIMVLLGIFALFMGGFGTSSTGLTLEAAKTQGCQQLIRTGKCGIWDGAKNLTINFDSNQDGNISSTDDLYMLCIKYYGAPPPSSDDTSKRAFREACNVRVCGCGA